MLDAVIKKLKQLTVEPVPYDPGALGDDLASRTEWTPKKGGGASFQTHRFVEVDMHRAEFKAAPGALAFAIFFVLMGIVPATIISFALAATPDASALFLLLPIGVGLLFAGIGGGIFYFTLAPIVFDKRRGEYWKGRTAPYEAANQQQLKNFAKLNGIHALQIVSERVRSQKSSYMSYELNLVLDDASRLNVVDHGNLERLRADAARLSAFLGKPVWDATGG